MPLLVHLAPAPLASRIRRNGVKPTSFKGFIPGHDRFVWAFPVLKSFTITHQWLRELKRFGVRTLVAVTFRIDDDEPVFANHYSQMPLPLTAAEAVGLIRSTNNSRGYQVMIPRRIEASEIVRIRPVPQGIGWRYWPNAKSDDRWPCHCPVCVPRGQVKSKRYRDRIPKLMKHWEERHKAK